jgi:Tol biopolymer transport system component/predicted Ser/Thr protein kinase
VPLSPGARVGVYEIIAALGAGGMGEVYRARDTRLGREVALKILPVDFAADRARRERFEQEARHVATLNHPNILAVFEVGTQDEVAFMATEFIDGQSLRAAALTPRKTLEIAAQIADGLAAAHAAGVTHRDLKPDNVMVTRDGRAKILDFGVAKATRASGDHELTVGQTDAGMVLGTAGYMAPEQVRGSAVDHRADIFAFGALLHELLSGTRAFVGDTAAERMTAVLKQDPPDLPPSVPPAVRPIVRRCLEKQPAERFQSARDLAFALRQVADDSSAPTASIAAAPRRRPGMWPIAVASLLFGVLVGTAGTVRWSASLDAEIDPVRLTRFSSDPMADTVPAFSPDGRTIAYRRIGAASTKIMAQALDAPSPVLLVDAPVALSAPVWTPDGRRVCYSTVERDLMCVSAAGGTPQRVLADATVPRFTPNGKSLLFIRAAEGAPWIFVSTPPGAEPRRRTDLPLPRDFSGFVPSPDGTRALVLASSTLSVMSLSNGSTTSVGLPAGTEPWAAAWFPDNRHLALSERTSDPAAFRLVVADTATSARRLVHRDTGALNAVAVSPDGTRIAYQSGEAEFGVHEYTMDGAHTRSIATSANWEGFPAWTPRGDRLMFVVGGPGRADSLWTAGANGGEPSRLLTLETAGLPAAPRFSPDGGRIAYATTNGVQTVSSSGGRPITVTKSSLVSSAAVCWSPDSEWVWYTEAPPPTLRKAPSQGGDPISVRTDVGRVLDCSPDGRWISAMGKAGFTLFSTDGKEERLIAGITEYPSRAENTMQFGDDGRVLYMLRFDRRSIAILDVATGKPRTTVTFQIPPAEIIDGFAIHPDGTRALLTIGLQSDDIWIAEGFAQPAAGWRALLRHWR